MPAISCSPEVHDMFKRFKEKLGAANYRDLMEPLLKYEAELEGMIKTELRPMEEELLENYRQLPYEEKLSYLRSIKGSARNPRGVDPCERYQTQDKDDNQ